MAVVSSAPAAMVDFPSSGQDLHPSTSLDLHYQRPTYLPFRRISLPSAPNLQHRQSIVSTASFDSLPEENHAVVPVTPVVIRNAVRGPRQRPSSTDVARRVRRKESRMVNQQKEAKRRKVIAEFYETEKSYLDGLELIHSVRIGLFYPSSAALWLVSSPDGDRKGHCSPCEFRAEFLEQTSTHT
ncbi:hypothetical protein PYCCODRAFT_297791 [Trametes coccinea BRFM310]|uniref:DH domain-containing protein n=1 Tax=Trametes coccinea (strain BRFM310) TaxID=1353009 RepID=A0A1Y2I8E9_TRAC3|nr:hypothetical protein PYCCODRAFT_297791 [Trametes coccinea BRFM310]